MRKIIIAAILLSSTVLFAQKDASVSFEKWISLKSVGGPIISPDGKIIVYGVSSTDWANNSYDNELWMVKDGETPVQLTRTNKNSSGNAAFTPDGKYVSFVADRGDKRQIYIISVAGGEAIQVTKDEDGINSYLWNPDGTKIVYSKTQPESKKDKTKKERFGAFGIEGEEYQLTHLWILNFNYDSVFLAGQLPCYTSKDSSKSNKSSDCVSLPVAKPLTEGNFNVGGFSWSPDGKQIAFNRQTDPLINSGITSDIVLIDIVTKKMTTVISNPVGDFFSAWSPDGKAFVYSSLIDDSVSNFYKNNRVFIYDLNTKTSTEIAKDIDEDKSVVDWNKSGLFVSAFEKTKRRLYSVNTKTGLTEVILSFRSICLVA
jgi:dipeptidyl aminopeptidase/acylaminoacyl peptidase